MESIQIIMKAHQRAMSDATGQIMAKAVEVATGQHGLARAQADLATAQASLRTAQADLAQAQVGKCQLEAHNDHIRMLQNIIMVSESTQSSTNSSPDSKK